MGGAHTPSLGFAMGLERLLLLIEAQGIQLPEGRECEVYIASIGEKASLAASEIVTDLRSGGISAQFDVVGRSVKAQMKYAGKIGAQYSMVLGDSEIDNNKAMLKNMETGDMAEVELDTFAEDFMNIMVQNAAKGLGDYIGGENFDLGALLGTLPQEE